MNTVLAAKISATICFALVFLLVLPMGVAAALPALEESITPEVWHVLGPFRSGSRESGFDPTYLDDGSHLELPPDFSQTFGSILAPGGRAGWVEFTADEDGKLAVALDIPDWYWEFRESEWGFVGTAWRGYAYTEVRVDEDCRAVVDAQRVGSFRINGRSYMGDPYGHGRWQTPVKLDAGVNRILVGLRGYSGEDEITFRILPAPEVPARAIARDVLVPDIRQLEPLDSWAGIPIVNYTDEWLEGIEVQFGPAEGIAMTSAIAAPIPPLGVLKVPVAVRTESQLLGHRFSGDEIEVPVKLTGEGFEDEVSVKMRVRRRGDSYRVTFISGIDRSVQKFSVRPPVPFDPEREYALILACHGAGVDSDGKVDAYSSKDWAYVIAPTNRRRFGFDWQDWGRLDFLEVREEALRRFNIDEDRVILTGHSMGGHGAWHIGTTHPDLFAAIVPSAGWASFQTYVPYLLRQSELFGAPGLRNTLDKLNAPDQAELLLPNLINVPVLAVHGSADDNVPVTHSRLLIGELDRLGYDARLLEVPDAGHWWDFDEERPGADCVDSVEIMEFMRDKVRVEWPDEVVLVTYDLANANSSYWVTVLAQEELYARTEVWAKRTSMGIQIKTQNVSVLRLDYPPEDKFKMAPVMTENGSISGPGKKDSLVLVKTFTGWEHSTDDLEIGRKFSGVSGPIKRAYYSPFIFVDASDGTEQVSLEICRNLAIRWWYRSNGYAPVKRWSDVTEEEKEGFNLIIVGTAKVLPKEFRTSMPIRLSSGPGVSLLWETVWGKELAAKFVYPSPFNPDRLVLVNTAHSEDALKVCGTLTALYSGSSLPDFIIADRTGVGRHALAGVKAMGFFDADWNFDESLAYIAKGSIWE